MVFKSSSDLEDWIAYRIYRVRRRDHNDWQNIFVGLGTPQELPKGSYLIESSAANYGCLIQTGSEITKHFVPGRDELEALCHGILAIERFLVDLSSLHEVTDLNGALFNLDKDGLFFGPIGFEYLKLAAK